VYGAGVYCVYLLANGKHGTLYAGITDDLSRRVYQHRIHAFRGFTARYNVSRHVWFEACDNPANAMT
jgi:putative endonuclease